MTAPLINTTAEIWGLAAGTRIRELGSMGRMFTVGVGQGQLWHGETPCKADCVELPAVVIHDPRWNLGAVL